ncbi:sigma-54-dependent transcriptional regulator [Roseateles oligotrophus]|nr:sigma-54 dependent transcriptional regulator [Roseateles oligotrophus]
MEASPSPNAPILVADDDAAVRAALRLFLKSEGLSSVLVASPQEALAELAQGAVGLLLADLNYARDTTSGEEGLALIRQARAQSALLPIVAMTAWGSIPLAVQALQLGANDFIEKPWDNTRLAAVLRNQLSLHSSRQQAARLAAENALLQADSTEQAWLGQSPALLGLMRRVAAVAAADVNLLITGENGTGKSQLAQAIHRQNHKAGGPFISLNMGAIPDTLFESELFGVERGAFTDARQTRLGRFELADGGTLFLDEVGNIPLAQQAKLLRVLESGAFERLGSATPRRAQVRLISATNADLDQLVSQGLFRRDLLYRLNSVQLHLPPLRERGADILLLAQHFLAGHARRYQRPALALAESARQALLNHAWPGNVRELSHCLERACLLSPGDAIEAADLGLQPQAHAPARELEQLTLDEAEKLLIRKALQRSQGNALAAAQTLGLSRSAFYRRLEKHQL